ncbi:MAG: VWA domain-containing protein [Candidatus Sericytochromatia bacterium]|nr:VWA domain-containing protein [Candidatus Sericytochromatia bacterium]
MLENIRFANPLFLFILLIIPFLFYYEKYLKKYASIKFSSIGTLKLAKKEKRFNWRFIPLFLRLLTISLFIITLARPQIGQANSEVLTEGIDIMLAIDTSGSMAAVDLTIGQDRATRLDVVKKVVKDFVAKRTTDPTGLIVFGTEAFTQCPLTLDTNILNQFVGTLEIGMAGDSTSIGNAIGLAVTRLKDAKKSKSKVIILLTDGANTSGKVAPDKATEIAVTYGIKIYTIGIGTSGKIPFVQNTVFGPQIVYGEADLDEKALKIIADKTGGMYYRAKNTNELEKIYGDINKLEKSEVKIKKYMDYKELFSYFLIPALLFLLLEIILSNTRFLRIP